MLTPEYIKELEENKIVEMYRQLNIDICADIIRILAISTKSTKKDDMNYVISQLKTLRETGGDEIYEQLLLNTQELDSSIKEELKQIYQNLGNENLQGYEKLYQYRDLPFKMSSSQIKILNGAIKQTSGELKNFTNTIAFSGKQLYVDAVNQAYLDTLSGGLSYTSAIEKAVKMVADKGITLQDKAGRNVRIETAVKRNILTGIKQTADRINQEIDEELGCDGYETTAHRGARPEHALWQGKQFAKTQKLANKYNVPLWDKSAAKDELNDFGCRHTYVGIILGISEPTYTQRELDEMNNTSIKINGKEYKEYEVSSKITKLESEINKSKTKIEIYEKNKSNPLCYDLMKEEMIVVKAKENELGSIEYQLDNQKYYKLSDKEYKKLSKKQKVTKENKDIIKELYIGKDYASTFNEKIRSAEPFKEKDRILDNALEKTIKSNKLNKNIILERNVGHNYLTKQLGIDVNKSNRNTTKLIKEKIGETIAEDAYMSCSATKEQVIEGNIKLILYVPKKTHAYITDNYLESEVILGKNTKYKITDVIVDNEKILSYTLIVEVLKQ